MCGSHSVYDLESSDRLQVEVGLEDAMPLVADIALPNCVVKVSYGVYILGTLIPILSVPTPISNCYVGPFYTL